jgi:predicted protein tyrosine phosphatase
MHPIIRVAPEAEFLSADLNKEYDYVISIQDAARYPAVLRPDFKGARLNLYFDDIVEGATVAKEADIAKLYEFALDWQETVRRDSPRARLIIHCLAGVSRSAATAMLPLVLHYGSFREAARRLFLARQYLHPNTWILHLIEERLLTEERLRLGTPGTIFEAVLEFQT